VESDAGAIVSLYRDVAAPPGGLARDVDEISPEYVGTFLARAVEDGVGFVAVPAEQSPGPPRLAGELHAYPPGPRAFAHLLGELTVAVHPDWQGRGVGRALFAALLSEVERHRPQVTRVELVARESNARAIGLYESLGFRREGRLEGRVRRQDGVVEADIPMAWVRNRS
jgi:putative acetyltransferase